MATINSLYLSISNMSKEQLLSHIMSIRANRRTQPTKAVRKKKTQTGAKAKRKQIQKTTNPKALASAIGKMSETDKLKLFLELTQGGKK